MLPSFFLPLLHARLLFSFSPSLFSSLAAVDITLFLSGGNPNSWPVPFLQLHGLQGFCMTASHAEEMAFLVHPCVSGRHWWRLCRCVEGYRSMFCSFPPFVSFYLTADGTDSTSETQQRWIMYPDSLSPWYEVWMRHVSHRNKDTSTTVLITVKLWELILHWAIWK